MNEIITSTCVDDEIFWKLLHGVLKRDGNLLKSNEQKLDDGVRLTFENPLLLSAKSLNLTTCEPD